MENLITVLLFFATDLWLRFKSTPLSKLATGLFSIRDAPQLDGWDPHGARLEYLGKFQTTTPHIFITWTTGTTWVSTVCRQKIMAVLMINRQLGSMKKPMKNKESRTNEPQIARFEFNIQNHWTFFSREFNFEWHVSCAFYMSVSILLLGNHFCKLLISNTRGMCKPSKSDSLMICLKSLGLFGTNDLGFSDFLSCYCTTLDVSWQLRWSKSSAVSCRTSFDLHNILVFGSVKKTQTYDPKKKSWKKIWVHHQLASPSTLGCIFVGREIGTNLCKFPALHRGTLLSQATYQ